MILKLAESLAGPAAACASLAFFRCAPLLPPPLTCSSPTARFILAPAHHHQPSPAPVTCFLPHGTLPAPRFPLQKQGLTATGQLAGVSKTAGFGSVSALLKKNPNAKALATAPKPKQVQQEGSGEEGEGGSSAAGEGAQKKQGQRKRQPEAELRDESELGPRPCAMPVSTVTVGSEDVKCL